MWCLMGRVWTTIASSLAHHSLPHNCLFKSKMIDLLLYLSQVDSSQFQMSNAFKVQQDFHLQYQNLKRTQSGSRWLEWTTGKDLTKHDKYLCSVIATAVNYRPLAYKTLNCNKNLPFTPKGEICFQKTKSGSRTALPLSCTKSDHFIPKFQPAQHYWKIAATPKVNQVILFLRSGGIPCNTYR